MKKIMLFKNFILEDIVELILNCKKYNIIYYTINPDRSIDVDGNVYLNSKGLTELPLKFNKVSGNFYCNNNKLTSLLGFPKEVYGDFNFSDNRVTSLLGCPQEVRGNFNCGDNQLTSLLGCPKEVGGNFDCYSNKLTSLKGAPEIVVGKFVCNHNELTSLKGAPEKVGGGFYCRNNKITSLKGSPKKVGNFDCENNNILDFKYLPLSSLNNQGTKYYFYGNPINEFLQYFINVRPIDLHAYLEFDNFVQYPYIELEGIVDLAKSLNVQLPENWRDSIKSYKILN